MKIIKIFSVLGMAVLLAACQPREQDLTGGDPLEKAYQKIDRGQYDQAISDLEALYLKTPKNEIREALASAYAARAGIFVERYWGAVVGFGAPPGKVRPSKMSEATLQMFRQLEQRPELKGRKELRQLAEVLSSFSVWMDRLELLPTTDSAGQEDLREALFLLQEHDGRGGRLYRAILGLVLLKSQIVDGYEGWEKIEERLLAVFSGNLPGNTKQDVLCVVDFAAFADWSLDVVVRLREAVQDYGAAFPSKKKSLVTAVEQSNQIAAEFHRVGGQACR